MSKTHRDYDADGGGGNSNDQGSVDENDAFEKLFVNGKGDDEAEDGDEEIGDLAECNLSSIIEVRVGVMR